MLKIRLQRIGRKNEPHYRVIVTEAGRGPKSGKIVEQIGSYNPKVGTVQVDAERVAYWIGVGAQASDTTHNMLVGAGVIAGKKRNNLPYKKPYIDPEAVKRAEEEAKKKEEAEAKARAEAEAAQKAAEEAEAQAQETPVDEEPASDIPAQAEASEEASSETPAEPETSEESASE